MNDLRSKWPKSVKALALAIGGCLLMFFLAALASWLPLENSQREGAVNAILSPLTIVSEALARIVDLLGPKGRPERASAYLPPWAGYSMLALSVVLLVVFFFGVALAALTWADKRATAKAP